MLKQEEVSVNKEKEITPQQQLVGYIELFRYADTTDIFLMIIGALGGIGFGVIQPCLSIILGNVINSFLDYGRVVQPMKLGLVPYDQSVIDQAQESIKNGVYTNVYYFIGVGGAAFVAAYIMQSSWLCTGERQSHRIREKYMKAVLRQDVSFFDDNEVGGLTAKLSSDTLIYQEGISSKVGFAFSSLSMFFTGFIIAFIKGWQLTLVLLSSVPLLGIGGYYVGKSIAEETSNSQDKYTEAASIVQETLANIKTVLAFRGQNKALKKFAVVIEKARKSGELKAWKMGIGFGFFFGILYGVYALAFWYGAKLANDGVTSGGTILNVIFAIIIGAFSIVNLGPALQNINKARGVAKGLFDVIETKPAINSYDTVGKKKLKNFKGSIEFRNVSFAYPKRPDIVVLKNFSMKVEPGQSVALVGFSGSGKSTIIQLLERFYDPIEGEILIDGIPLKELDLVDLRSKFGLVSQEPILFDATIEENIRYGAPEGVSVSDKQILDALSLANATSFVQKLSSGVKTRVGERGSLLSGGQKQRIAIARAIIKNPGILLLDEATSALDTESERVVQKALDEASKNRTTITIAHRLSTIKKANTIIVMNGGVVLEVGDHETLLNNNGPYAELVRVQELKTKESDLPYTIEDEKDFKEKLVNQGAVAVNVLEGIEEGLNKNYLKESSEEEKEKSRMREIVKNNRTPLLRVLKMQKPELPVLLLGVLGAGGSGALLPIFGVIFGQVLAVFSKTGKDLIDGASHWAIIFTILMFLNFTTNCFQFGFFGISGERLTERIRKSYFLAIMRQEASFFDLKENGTGAMTARLAQDAERINNLTGPIAGSILQLLVSLGLSLGLSFYYSWQMTLVVLGIIPILGVFSYFEQAATFGTPEQNEKLRKSYAIASQTACDAIANIRTVKSFNAENIFTEEYTANIRPAYLTGLRTAYLSTIGYGLSQAIQFWIYALAFYAGYKFVIAGYIQAGDLFTVLFAILFGSISLTQAATYTPDILKARVAAIQYFQLIDRVPLIDNYSEEGEKPHDVAGKASIKDVEFSYPQRKDVKILKGINLDIAEGKRIALVGPSGSGKSTIVSLLERFYDPDSGTVSVEKTNVKSWNIGYLRGQMAIVSQEPTLFIGTIAENIAYGKDDATQEEIESVAKQANIHNFIQGLPDKYNTEISNSQLSGGQKQRIAIARALLVNPKILLLDEATSALDSESERLVQDALVAASKNRTSLTIAHRLSTVQNSDWIIVMKDGVVEEEGTHFELIEKKGLYSTLVQQQQLSSNKNS